MNDKEEIKEATIALLLFKSYNVYNRFTEVLLSLTAWFSLCGFLYSFYKLLKIGYSCI